MENVRVMGMLYISKKRQHLGQHGTLELYQERVIFTDHWHLFWDAEVIFSSWCLQ